jgi:hypothetical protein
MSNKSCIISRAILSQRNDWVDMINMKMISRFQGDEMMYHSFDSAVDDPHNYYPSEFLNTLTPNGLPPYVLKLKIGCPVILLRNIDPAGGLCNGTRLVIRGFQRNTVDAEIMVEDHAGKRIFLPQIPLCPSDDEMFSFQFKRKQFPIRLSFAMTINKAQGRLSPMLMCICLNRSSLMVSCMLRYLELLLDQTSGSLLFDQGIRMTRKRRQK